MNDCGAVPVSAVLILPTVLPANASGTARAAFGVRHTSLFPAADPVSYTHLTLPTNREV